MSVIQDKASILVVDDNPLIVNVLKSLFGSEQYQVFTCSNGNEALNVLDSKQVDVIICDVMMPEMDGYSFHNTVRGKAELAHIPFLFLTALGSEDEMCRGMEAGADDYMVKPFDPRELLSVVKGKVVRSRGLRNFSEERYDSYRKRVIHTLSHEFRTPLVAINTGTELLLEQEGSLDNHKIHNLLEAIQRGGHRLERLVNDFMLLQQIEAGIAKRLYDQKGGPRLMSEVVRSVLDSQAEWLDLEKFTVKVVDRASDVWAHMYEPQIAEILKRLIANAVKFSNDTKAIEVHINRRAEELYIEVRDRGIGIDVDRVREAIDVFGQIDRDRLEQQGGGLGLAISNRYAQLNQGRLEFERRKDGGSVISLVLPVCQRG